MRKLLIFFALLLTLIYISGCNIKIAGSAYASGTDFCQDEIILDILDKASTDYFIDPSSSLLTLEEINDLEDFDGDDCNSIGSRSGLSIYQILKKGADIEEQAFDSMQGAPSAGALNSIQFVPPTPDDGASSANATVSVSVDGDDDHYVFLDWKSSNVLWMMMDSVDGSGNPQDISGHGNSGTASGASQAVSGKFGNGFSFDGVDDYISVSHDESIDLGRDESFTVSVWVNKKDTAQETIFRKGDFRMFCWGNPCSRFEVTINDDDPDTTLLYAFNGIASDQYIDKWNNFVVTWDSVTGTVSTYVNGVAGTSKTNTNFGDFSSTSNLEIGKGWNGFIDDVLVFDRLLSSIEINALYDAVTNQYSREFFGFDGEYSFQANAVDVNGNIYQTEERVVRLGSSCSLPGETRSCGTDVGECVAGTETCIDGFWSTGCIGEVVSGVDVCNDGLDNDCDGDIDEDCAVDKLLLCERADMNGDDEVNLEDFVMFKNNFGCSDGSDDCVASDIDSDGDVDLGDFVAFKNNFGRGNCSSQPWFVGMCENIVSGNSSDDKFQIFNGTLWINGEEECVVRDGITLLGLGGDDIFVTVGAGSQTIYGGEGFDSYWFDSEDSVENVSSEEEIWKTVHNIIAYYQPGWVENASDPSDPYYVGLDSRGEDLRDPIASKPYQSYDGPLYGSNGPLYSDIEQGQIGDCYFLATLATLADKQPEIIKQSIVEIGDGNYIARYYIFPQKPEDAAYVKMDSDLSTDSDGNLRYAKFGDEGAMWVSMMEKGFAHWRYETDNYAVIDLGWPEAVFAALVGLEWGDFGNAIWDYGDQIENEFVSIFSEETFYVEATGAMDSNEPVALSSNPSDYDPIVGSHVYALHDTEDPNYAVVYNTWGRDGASWDSNSGDGLLKINSTYLYDAFYVYTRLDSSAYS